MPRMPKTYVKDGLYLTTSRADGNLKIFSDKEDYDTYRKLLAKYKQQYQFKLYAFVLLPSYLHLLIELREGLSLSNILHDINSTYTKYYNSKYQRKGHVFQERYRVTLAEKSSWLLPLADYIHTAPGREATAIDHVSYRFSSFPIYCEGGNGEPDLREEVAEAESASAGRAGKSYRERLAGADRKQLDGLAKELKKPVIGPADFVERVNAEAASRQAQQAAPVPQEMPMKAAAALALAALAALTVLLLINHFSTSAVVKKELARKDAEFSVELAKERKFIAKDLEEKYRADQVSYQALAKRLEIEKRKRLELENKTEPQK